MRENILLINPAINPSSQNKVINSIINTTFPTSLGSVAAFLSSQGINSVRIIDEQINFIKSKDLPQIILSLEKPRIIGLSALTLNSKRAYELAESIKAIDPDSLVVVGGIHPTVLPEEALNCKGVDVVVRGEGEETFSELVSLVLQGNDFSKISGISFKGKAGITHNAERQMIMNLDDIPPFPYHLFENDRQRYPSFAGILTSRGCPYNCIFCSSRSVSGKRYRYFSVERVISEINLLVNKYRQKIIWLMDDNIAADRGRFIKLLEAIKKEKFPEDVSFHGSMRADNISDEILDKVKQANFRMIAFGMETGNESLMSLINKGESVKQVVDAIKKTADRGIAVATTIIFGLPAETRRDRRQAIRAVLSLPLSSVRYNILTPYPGTPAFEVLNARGEVFIKKDWENFAVQYMWEASAIPYVPKGNNVYELIFDTMLANLSFYLSLRGIKRMLKSSFAGGNVIRMSEAWYLSPKTIWNFILVVLYLNYRFATVSLRMLVSKIKIPITERYKDIKESLDSFIKPEKDNQLKLNSVQAKQLYNSYLKKTFENVLYERYACPHKPLQAYFPFNYQKIPKAIRYNLQKPFRNNFSSSGVFPAWPLEERLENLRETALRITGLSNESLFKKIIWPEGRQYALILTHDIEDSDNWEWVRRIAQIELDCGFRSSWNVVPRLYKIDYAVLDWLAANGFEIGLHDYNHDNKMAFLKEGQIRSRIEENKNFINRYDIRGFRSSSWLRSDTLFKVLQDYFLYDSSMLDVDYISAQGLAGCCSVFPFRLGKIVELPVTLPYELPLQFGTEKSGLNNFWKNKIEWIKKTGGVVNVITHPDPYYGGNETMVNLYREFLESFEHDKEMICMLPAEAAEHYNNWFDKKVN